MNNNTDFRIEAILSFVNAFLPQKTQLISLQSLFDGRGFASMLKSADGLRFNFGQFHDHPENWSERISNLRAIIKKVQWYFENKIGKGIRTKDIKLVEIAHYQNIEEILKMFEIVLAVLTECSNKEDHINKILLMCEETQKVFVELIQNISETRILQINQTKQEKTMVLLDELEVENALLREEIANLQNEKEFNLKEFQDLKIRTKYSENELTKTYNELENEPEELNSNILTQNQQLKTIIENLKKKLSSITKEHKIQAYAMKEQIRQNEEKIEKLQKLEEICQFYQQKYNETQILIIKAKNWEKENNKLKKAIQQKESIIKRIQDKLEQVMEENCAIQERMIYLQMELEKRQMRFRELQKEVKRRISTNDDSNFTISEKTGTNTSSSLFQLNESQKQEMEDMKMELQKVRQNQEQKQKENNKLKKEVERIKNYQKEKKKLHQIILSLSKEKQDQISILLGVLEEMRTENQRFAKILAQNKISV